MANYCSGVFCPVGTQSGVSFILMDSIACSAPRLSKVCIPLRTVNAVSAFEPEWIAWEEGKEWIREKTGCFIKESSFFPFCKGVITFAASSTRFTTVCMTVFIRQGVRSGKCGFANHTGMSSGRPLIFITPSNRKHGEGWSLASTGRISVPSMQEYAESFSGRVRKAPSEFHAVHDGRALSQQTCRLFESVADSRRLVRRNAIIYCGK